jgi:hypothetical protein
LGVLKFILPQEELIQQHPQSFTNFVNALRFAPFLPLPLSSIYVDDINAMGFTPFHPFLLLPFALMALGGDQWLQWRPWTS